MSQSQQIVRRASWLELQRHNDLTFNPTTAPLQASFTEANERPRRTNYYKIDQIDCTAFGRLVRLYFRDARNAIQVLFSCWKEDPPVIDVDAFFR